MTEGYMAVVKPTKTAEVPLSRLGLNLVRSYLGNRWALLVLFAGIALNWSWLVAAGIAPILLSTLPCLVMCGLGLCILCGSSEKQTAARDAADAATSSAPLAIAKVDNPAAGAATCCHEHVNE